MELRKRIESLLWRSAMMGLAVAIDYISGNLVGLQIPAQVTVLIGLILGEVSKEIRNQVTRY